MADTPTHPVTRSKSTLKHFPSYMSLSFSTSRLSLSEPIGARHETAHVTDASSSRLETFCSHPIKRTSNSVRRLLQKASQSLRFSTGNEQSGVIHGMKKEKGKFTLGDGESGIGIDEKEIEDWSSAVDTTVVRKGSIVLRPPGV